MEYTGAELWEVELAWATTVHKAQGSESKAVIVVLSPAHRPLLTRRLFYTGAMQAGSTALATPIVSFVPRFLMQGILPLPFQLQSYSAPQRISLSVRVAQQSRSEQYLQLSIDCCLAQQWHRKSSLGSLDLILRLSGMPSPLSAPEMHACC